MKLLFKKSTALFAVSLSLALVLGACATASAPTPSPEPAAPPASEAPAEQPSAAPETEAANTAADPNYPTRNVQVVVPWNPGGGTDLTVRGLVEEMSTTFGVSMPVANMAGASGSIGMQDVYDSPKDGYKILGHGMMAFTNSQVMGLTDVSYKDWTTWVAAFSPNVICVGKDSPYNTIDDLIAAMKANPNTITAGSAGVGTGGHIGATVFADGVGATYEHIPYSGGAPAITACLSGEVDFLAQLSMEMIDMIISGDLRALACLNDEDMVIQGANGEITIPSIKAVAPEMASMLPVGESFGIMVPNGTDEGIISAIDSAYQQAIVSDSFQTLAESKGVVVFGYGPEESATYLDQLASIVCWTLFDSGSAKISPDTVGIPRLE